jgi:hypothetical protein
MPGYGELKRMVELAGCGCWKKGWQEKEDSGCGRNSLLRMKWIDEVVKY